MATPVFVDLPADTWTKIATNEIQGQVHLINTAPNQILQTYIQPSGDPAPADDPALGVPAFENAPSEEMQFTIGTDVYLRPVGEASRVRVDV
jgi:hypothetical protein